MHTTTLGTESGHPRDVVTIAAALPRRQRPANLRAEAAGLNELSKILATEPSMARPSILEIARVLCHAGTAGVSLLRLNNAGETVVHWEAVSGALAAYEGIDMPRQSTPCGRCLDVRTAILVSRPARFFTALTNTHPSICEYLIVPLYDATGAELGTIWLAHHDSTSRFSSDDARIVEQLAHQLVLGMKLEEHARNRDQAVSLLQSQQIAQRNLIARTLQRERTRRKQAQAAEREARRALAFSEAMVIEVNHRTKNTLQAAAALLSLQARASSSVEVSDALLDSRARLHSLAVVHAMLGDSRARTQTVRMRQLLEAICDAFRESYGYKQSAVTLQLTSDSVALPVNDAIPIALVANEAITNAYKHAFPHAAAGEIAVHLQRTPDHALVLRVADTGVGADFAATGGGIGLMLMRTLAAHLHGVLDVAPREDVTGTQITLTIERSTGRSP